MFGQQDDKEYQARSKTYDEIAQYARGKMAQQLGAKFAPKQPEPEAAPEAQPEGDESLDQESLSRLAAMAGE